MSLITHFILMLNLLQAWIIDKKILKILRFWRYFKSSSLRKERATILAIRSYWRSHKRNKIRGKEWRKPKFKIFAALFWVSCTWGKGEKANMTLIYIRTALTLGKKGNIFTIWALIYFEQTQNIEDNRVGVGFLLFLRDFESRELEEETIFALLRVPDTRKITPKFHNFCVT